MLLLEHPSVYTAGKRTEPLDRPFDGTPVVDVDRGGKITWHGPGQLVGYPILRLPRPGRRGRVRAPDRAAAHRRLRRVRRWPPTGSRAAAASGCRADDRGPDRKVAAIGIRVARGVTLHGFALNCDCDLAHFDRIVPCGIRDAGVTSLSAELGRAGHRRRGAPGRRAPPARPCSRLTAPTSALTGQIRADPERRSPDASSELRRRSAALRGQAVQVAREQR